MADGEGTDEPDGGFADDQDGGPDEPQPHEEERPLDGLRPGAPEPVESEDWEADVTVVFELNPLRTEKR